MVSHEETGTQLDLEAECEELNTYLIILDIVSQRVLKKKVQELTYLSTTSMCLSSVKYKRKRTIKKSRKCQESVLRARKGIKLQRDRAQNQLEVNHQVCRYWEDKVRKSS